MKRTRLRKSGVNLTPRMRLAKLSNILVKIRPMTSSELKSEGWELRVGLTPMVMVFADGTKVFPSVDPEGNDYGTLFSSKGRKKFIIMGSGK